MPFAVSGVSGVSGAMPSGLLDQLEPGRSTGTGSELAFSGLLSSAVQDVTDRQTHAADLSIQAVTGELENVHEYTIAATEAQVALELTVALRNKAVDAFNEIMRMQA